jgi:hypothetical protein
MSTKRLVVQLPGRHVSCASLARPRRPGEQPASHASNHPSARVAPHPLRRERHRRRPGPRPRRPDEQPPCRAASCPIARVSRHPPRPCAHLPCHAGTGPSGSHPRPWQAPQTLMRAAHFDRLPTPRESSPNGSQSLRLRAARLHGWSSHPHVSDAASGPAPSAAGAARQGRGGTEVQG